MVKVLNENDFLHLARSYHADVYDGVQWVVHLRTGGRDKYVTISNAFPPPLVAVARFVVEQIVDARPDLAERSLPVHLPPQAYSDHLWRAASRYAGRRAGAPDADHGPRLTALLLPDDPLPKGARIEAAIVDLGAGGKVVAHAVAERPFFWVPYAEDRIDPRHRYALEVKLTAGGKALAASEALPVITYDGEQALEVPLPRP